MLHLFLTRLDSPSCSKVSRRALQNLCNLRALFQTETIDEHNTSKTCPCCKDKSLKAVDFVKESFTIHKHHLLRYTNELCHSRWWNRNVFNILDRLLNLVHR